MLLSSAANDNIDFDIVLDEGKVIGYSIVSYAGNELEIQSLAIAKEYRRKHNGRALLDFVLAKAAKKGVQTAFLEVRKSNTAAFNLYKSFGFELLAIREKYYKDEDALVLRKTLK
jgi:ribosomal-protein-alanine N-acetyltransferase